MRLILLLILLSIVPELSTARACKDKGGKFKVKTKKKSRAVKCNWVAAKQKKKRCRKKTIDGKPIKNICRKTCNNCPTQPPVPEPTNAPNPPVSPTKAPVSPTIAPVSSGNGCCTLDYKSCISWCGETKESCMSCSNSDVGWIPDGIPSDNCKARWIGCGDDMNSCCDGLSCQDDGSGYFSCKPDDGTPTPPSPTNAPVSPTKAPVPVTTPPQPSPTNAPVSPTKAPVSPTIAPVSSGNGCCTLDYKSCISWCGETKESCMSCSNSDVGWIPDGIPSDNCKARWIGCGDDMNSCCDGLSCQDDGSGYFSCKPDDGTPTPPSPTNAPVSPTKAPVPVTTPPQPSPTNAPVSPTKAPVSPTIAPVSSGNGCCSLDYKHCVDWCGSTYNSCMSCGNTEVVWLPNGPRDTCGERWTGCGQDNDDNHSGCCSGLTCQWRGDGHDYFACLPGDGTPTPPNPTNPPQPNPTNPPQSSPVAPPTGGGGDWINGKATFYGGNESGNACGYNDLPKVTFPKGFSVAIGGDLFDDGYGCGACFEVTCLGPSGHNPGCSCGDDGSNRVIVQATDECPECSSTHFDLNTAAFESIVAPGLAGTCGIIRTSFRRVSCDFKSNIKIRSKGGTSGYWYGLHVDDVAGYGAIQSVKLREAGRRQNGQNAFDIVCRKSEGASFWLCDRPGGREIFANLDVELVDSAGRVLRTNNVITNLGGGQEFDFRKNFGPIVSEPTQPTIAPVTQPTKAPVVVPTKAPAPTTPFSGDLLSSDKAMNAWQVYQGLDYITHKNSENPPNYALVAS